LPHARRAPRSVAADIRSMTVSTGRKIPRVPQPRYNEAAALDLVAYHRALGNPEWDLSGTAVRWVEQGDDDSELASVGGRGFKRAGDRKI
jgi:hypothetical protein